MSKIIFLCLITLFSAIAASAQTAGPIVRPTPTAKFIKIWTEPDATLDGETGVRIHVNFEVHNMKNVNSYLAIYFENRAGKRLKDKNKSYYSEAGDVAVFQELKPSADITVFEDEVLFIPYDEFDLTRAGKYNLRMDVDVITTEGNVIEHLTFHNFTYTKLKNTPLRPPPPAAVLDNIRVEFDVYENNRKGMKIHVDFEVYRLNDKDASLVVSLQNANGEPLPAENEIYSNLSGQLSVYVELKPAYVQTVYKDQTLFLPYDEIKIPAGRHELKMDVDVLCNQSSLHLGFYEFWFSPKN